MIQNTDRTAADSPQIYFMVAATKYGNKDEEDVNIVFNPPVTEFLATTLTYHHLLS